MHIETHRFPEFRLEKNNGVESHSETLALAVLCEYQHVVRKTSASDYIVSQNSVWKNNKQRDQVDLPAVYEHRSQARRFILYSTVYHVAATRLPTFRRRDVTSGTTSSSSWPDCTRHRNGMAASRHRGSASSIAESPDARDEDRHQTPASSQAQLADFPQGASTHSQRIRAGHEWPRPDTTRRLQWDDAKSAFRTRICTGIVSNLRHTSSWKTPPPSSSGKYKTHSTTSTPSK